MKEKNSRSTIPRIAIIGAGASGLSCAYSLANNGLIVDIYEKSSNLGGLASSTKLSKGRIDTFYHHLFESDKYILKFINKLGIKDKVIFKRTTTAHISENKYYDISGLKNLFASKLLSKVSYIQLLIGGAIIKYFPDVFNLKDKSILSLLDNFFGKEASNKIWRPLIKGKFGSNADLIPFSWLRARIKDRSINLGYARNGFEEIYEIISDEISKKGGKIFLNNEIQEINYDRENDKVILNNKSYDRLVTTLSPKTNKKILKNLNYKSSKISYIGALCGIFEFSKKPVPAYWTGITPSKGYSNFEYNDFLALISYAELDETWNKDDNKTWPVYIASYITEKEFKKFNLAEWEEKMKNSIIEISKISLGENAINESNIINSNIAFAEYAQPIISPGKNLFPNPEKAISTLFANMHNIYPNDRGQNRAFQIGEERASQILKELNIN